MLERLVVSRCYLWHHSAMSENASGAGNQQERRELIGWIVGFTDGEGCFSVTVFRNAKGRLRLGWQVIPEYVVTQGARSFRRLRRCEISSGAEAFFETVDTITTTKISIGIVFVPLGSFVRRLFLSFRSILCVQVSEMILKNLFKSPLLWQRENILI